MVVKVMNGLNDKVDINDIELKNDDGWSPCYVHEEKESKNN